MDTSEWTPVKWTPANGHYTNGHLSNGRQRNCDYAYDNIDIDIDIGHLNASVATSSTAERQWAPRLQNAIRSMT